MGNEAAPESVFARVWRPASATSSSAPAAGAREREWSAAGCYTIVKIALPLRECDSVLAPPQLEERQRKQTL